MEATVDSQPSLMSLEEELTCSICLSPFSCPVTIPCGHNFCQSCILETWTDSYICPQCRTVFPGKPELKKNTVLSAVVETFNQRASRAEVKLQVAELEPQGKDVIRCDTCMHTEASRTCLTCMASFCEEHLRPHRENPVFRLHQLTVPVGDLLERICSDHHKLMEFFCSQHGRPICSLCLQQVHKGCPFMSPEEQRTMKESELKGKLYLLDRKIVRNEDVLAEIVELQNKLKESALERKKAVSAEYQQIRDLLAREECDGLNAVDRELDSSNFHLKALMKKFSWNIKSMSKAKEDVRCLLAQPQTLAFLQASVNLPAATQFDPFTPRINLHSKKVTAAQDFAAALKEHLTEMRKQPVEERQLKFKPAEYAGTSLTVHVTRLADSGNLASQQFFHRERPYINPVKSTGFHPALQRTSGDSGFHSKSGPKKYSKKPPKDDLQLTKLTRHKAHSLHNLLEFEGKEKATDCTPTAVPKKKPEMLDNPIDITCAVRRHDLLKYGTKLTFDLRTAHQRIAISQGFTKATVATQHGNYPDNPKRFTFCSQVLASVAFSRGRHYWEVQRYKSNIMAIGLSYSSLDCKGPLSRLGRNAQSWSVEWLHGHLSAWYDNRETPLGNADPKRVGVLLDCEEGTTTFFNVADKAYPFHSFVFPSGCSGVVYPAFWISSIGSSITLPKLQPAPADALA
ncbi:E3 ubiquitin/ISG15 ligase TRIM25-like [Nelusetta ayraudi]|uniref:E3 ubiquitin/ISG15 ligase TRIM25-like n=1 Tax=Nelusetta ayraudi TaxID=303726 RepID=UPI003F6EF79D